MQNFNKGDSIVFISRFPPPYGGVSNQAKLLAEKLSYEKQLKIYIFDLLEMKIHLIVENKWQHYHFFSKKNLSIIYFLESIYLFFSSLNFGRKNELFNFDKFLIWRIALLLISSFLGSLISKEKIRLIYSFHIGAPSIVGGNLARVFNIPHMKAVFGEFFSNYEKINIQKKFIYSLAGKDLYFPCSNHCRNLMINIFKKADSEILYHGSDLKNIKKEKEKFLRKKRGNEITLSFLGRHEKEMGIEFFIDLIKILSNYTEYKFKFLLIGQTGKYTEFIENFSKDFSGNLEIYKSISNKVKNELLCKSDFLVVPSSNDRACFGLAIVEGIASKNFVMARNIGGHYEAVLRNDDYIFEKDLSPELLAKRIIKICLKIDNREFKLRLDALQKQIINNFDIEKCLDRQIIKIKEIINS